jgi:prepilin-type N-terminal cleavage/methylation domain-containing protein
MKWKNQKGLSLLEVLISMLILAFGVLGLAPLVVVSIEGNNVSRDVLNVTNIAKGRMEFLQSVDPMPTVPFLKGEPDLYGAYSCTTRVWDNSTDTLLPSGLYKAVVTIDWTDKVGMVHHQNFSTFIDK